MLPKPHRLPGYRIPELITSRTRFSGPIANLILSKSTEGQDAPSRFTVIVPVRLSKKAVPRNRTKRLLREAVHETLSRIKPGYDGLVIAQKLLVGQKLKDITADIGQLLQKGGLV